MGPSYLSVFSFSLFLSFMRVSPACEPYECSTKRGQKNQIFRRIKNNCKPPCGCWNLLQKCTEQPWYWFLYIPEYSDTAKKKKKELECFPAVSKNLRYKGKVVIIKVTFTEFKVILIYMSITRAWRRHLVFKKQQKSRLKWWWLSGYEQWLLFQRTGIQFSKSTWQLTTPSYTVTFSM